MKRSVTSQPFPVNIKPGKFAARNLKFSVTEVLLNGFPTSHRCFGSNKLKDFLCARCVFFVIFVTRKKCAQRTQRPDSDSYRDYRHTKFTTKLHGRITKRKNE